MATGTAYTQNTYQYTILEERYAGRYSKKRSLARYIHYGCEGLASLLNSVKYNYYYYYY